MVENLKKTTNKLQEPEKLPETWFLDQLDWLLYIKHAVLSYKANWEFQEQIIDEDYGKNGKEIEQCANPRSRNRHQDEYWK